MLSAGVLGAVVLGAAVLGATQTPATDVPRDLRPLLTPKRSEMFLVVQRYALDRATLNGNYAGPGNSRGTGVGRAGNALAPASISLSRARIARLKRFDLNWQGALEKIAGAKLSAGAHADLQTLQQTIAANGRQLSRDELTLAETNANVPFAPKLVSLIEARIRIDPVNGQQAAATLNDAVKEIKAERDAIAKRGPKSRLVEIANATESLRGQLAEWFNFYNGYDPLFTWWVGEPFKRIDADLQSYAAAVREAAAQTAEGGVAGSLMGVPVDAAPPLKHTDVPDLQEILALPQDELSNIVTRFLAGANPSRALGAGTRGRGNGPSTALGASAAGGVDPAYYRAWLAALPSLDFDALSRNAQVDYLYIKRISETRLTTAGATLDPNPPRKTDNSGIPGAARGRQGLLLDLAEEMIPYTPEQLMALADKEYAWCEAEMKKASRQLGFGDDWKKAVEKVKDTYVAPGAQPAMIRDLLTEAVDYMRANDLVTVPQVGAESMHMIMMSPQAQLSNPFFLGGPLIQVSYPTDTMEYDARMQSMRGNNPAFSHATAFHEMIPGHYLTQFMDARFVRQGSRANLNISTPFYTEGWALYWELILYDMGFDKTPEQKIGALFWRMHRCARIIFSLKFHMGEWSPQDCIEFLIDKVGHERDNATAEVRRSFQGGYGPLYQAGYLLGGLQLRGLRRELVDTKRMTNRQFHDAILRQGTMPIALLRLAVTPQTLTRDMSLDWKFYGEIQ